MTLSFAADNYSCSLVTDADKNQVMALYQNKKVMRMISAPLTDSEADTLATLIIKRNVQPLPALKVWKITDSASGVFCGLMMLRWHDNTSRRCAEIGIMLVQSVNRKGVARKAMRALVEFAFLSLGVKEIYADFNSRHRVIEKLLLSLGFNASSQAQVKDGQTRFVVKNTYSIPS